MFKRIFKTRTVALGVSTAAVFAMSSSLLVGAPVNADNNSANSYTDGKTSVVEVTVKNEAETQKLKELGLDVVTEDAKKPEVLLQDQADADTLRKAGVQWQVVVPDVEANNRKARAQEEKAKRELKKDPSLASGLPTGRVSYRDLDEISAELKELARKNPKTVKLVTLPRRSLLGKKIYGVEVSHDVSSVDGKPVFALTGLTHSREWPTPELTLEFVWDLVKNDGKDKRITSLLDKGRILAVPVVNPDGYEMSRDLVQEQKRKNCRVKDGKRPTFRQCANPKNFDFGVDLNRNYDVFWGGPGAGADPTASNYRGANPKSEPEIKNMIDLMADRQVTVAISNHTPDERVLRAPSASNEPRPAEEAAYQGMAAKLGKIMGWPAGPWPDIYYEASGTAEQAAFYSAGTFAFTFENTPGFGGNDRFHPPYVNVIDQYLGKGVYAGSHGREAYLTAFEAAVDPKTHSVITGKAPSGAVLEIKKNVPLHTSAIEGLVGESAGVIPFRTKISSELVVPKNGKIAWHVTPSTRPSQAFTALMQESWTVTCADSGGVVKEKVKVSVNRGESVNIKGAKLKNCPRAAAVSKK